MTIKDIINTIDGRVTNIPHNINKKINNSRLDSRLVENGDIFICLNSGINYIDDAIKRGTICIISDEQIHIRTNICIIKVDNIKDTLLKISSYIRDKYHYIPLVAITGSVGKTSTKELLNSILNKKYKTLINESNHNNYIGVSDTMFKLNNDYDILIMELCMNHFNEINDMSTSIKPDIAVITNIGTSHIGNLGSKKNILKAKLEITNGLKGYLVVPYLDKYLNHIKYKNIIKCKDIKIHDIYVNDRLHFELEYDHKYYPINFSIPNKAYISNILVAFEVSTLFDIDVIDIVRGINEYVGVSSRMNIIKYNGFTLIDDTYNSSYESLKGALDYIKSINQNKLVILGDIKELGKYSISIHKKINKLIDSNEEVLLVGEDTKYIKGTHFNSNTEIIDYLKNRDLTNYVILIKGSRLMHMEEIRDYLLEK